MKWLVTVQALTERSSLTIGLSDIRVKHRQSTSDACFSLAYWWVCFYVSQSELYGPYWLIFSRLDWGGKGYVAAKGSRRSPLDASRDCSFTGWLTSKSLKTNVIWYWNGGFEIQRDQPCVSQSLTDRSSPLRGHECLFAMNVCIPSLLP